MQKRMKNRFKNFLIVTLSVLMMMPSTIAAFAKEGKDEKKIEKLELSATYSDYDIVATAEKDALPEGAKFELAKPFLVSLPLYTNNEWKHVVTIAPKSEVKKIPNEKPVVPPVEKPKDKPKAETGVALNSSIITMLGVLLTASIGIYMVSQKEEETC